MNRLPIMTVIVLTVGASWSQAVAKKPAAPLTREQEKAELAKLREVFASVDKLPARDARWVEVQAGPARDKTWHKGWLLRESKVEIRLLTAGGRQTFDKRKLAGGKPAADFTWSDVWAVRDADFAKHCRDFLAEKKKEAKEYPNEIGVYRFYREKAEANAAVVDAARLACWASVTGRAGLAGQLLKRAADKLRERNATYIGRPAGNNVHAFVADQTFPTERASSRLLAERKQDPRKARRLYYLEWNRALARIPYRTDHAAVLREIKNLESLVAEDRAWKEPSKEELARMDVKQKAAYWLYHLRDLNVQQASNPGMCVVLTDSPWSFQSQDLAREGTPNPAVELKKLGYEVLPQVIAHLDDGRPTRCVGFWRDYAPDSYYTLTYGDCCQQIFEAIALHSIYDRSSTNGYPVRDGQGKQCQERAEKWWREFQRKDEKRVLSEATARGDRDSYLNAKRLVQKYPEAAFEPVRDGIRAARESWIRSNLLNYMRELKDGGVVAFLEEEAKGGPHLYARVGAIEGLLQRGQEGAVALLAAEWMKLDPEKEDRDPFDGTKRLQAAMARCGHPKAIAALAARWKQIPVAWRHRTLEGLPDVDKDIAGKPFTPAARQAVEDFLIGCLRDQTEGERRRRTCDLAAQALAVRWGDPNLIDLSAPLSVRNRKIVEVENVWREKHGKEPLPVPAARKIPPVAAARVAPLLKAIIESSSDQARHDAGAAVEGLGLGALPRVRTELASLRKGHPARAALARVATRLTCIVSDVRFSDDSVARPDAMRKAAEALKNKPLSAEAFVGGLAALYKLVPSESGGLLIALDLDGDDTGIQLEVRVLPRRDPPKGGEVYLRRHEEVVVDGKELRNHTMTSGVQGQEPPPELDPAAWKGLVSSLQEALAAPPECQFQVRVEVSRGR
jgi:hypothetical protein